jgi:hypothetical protein
LRSRRPSRKDRRARRSPKRAFELAEAFAVAAEPREVEVDRGAHRRRSSERTRFPVVALGFAAVPAQRREIAEVRSDAAARRARELVVRVQKQRFGLIETAGLRQRGAKLALGKRLCVRVCAARSAASSLQRAQRCAPQRYLPRADRGGLLARRAPPAERAATATKTRRACASVTASFR